MTTYQNARGPRREYAGNIGRFRGGLLSPVYCGPVRPSEGGMMAQKITAELDPIAGRVVTQMFFELVSVFVPVQAMDALKNPDGDYAGLTEVVREKYISGNPLFGLENEHEISKRCRILPRAIGDDKKVSETIRLAHNCAVNFLRTRKYVKATKLLASSTAITPALITRTSLEMLNGVLDPDDRINGEVNLSIPTVHLPVSGVGVTTNTTAHPLTGVRETSGAVGPWNNAADTWTTGNGFAVRLDGVGATAKPAVFARMGGVEVQGMSLTDLYNAEKKDSLVRVLREIVDENAEYGEEMAVRYAHGMSVDPGRMPFILSQQRVPFSKGIVGASDTSGVQDKVRRSDMVLELDVLVPIPKTELGGVVITFATLKPDEVLAAQPHPFLSDNWGADNFLADELARDPVPVTVRDVDSNAAAAQQSTRVMYTGLNALKQTYATYGLSRQVDPTTVENKTAFWQLEIPVSVTPDNILYPAKLPHYPFADQLAEVCTFNMTTVLTLQSPMIVGPTPVEELAIIDSEDLFGDDE